MKNLFYFFSITALAAYMPLASMDQMPKIIEERRSLVTWIDIARNKFMDVEVSVPTMIERKKSFDSAEHEAQTNLVADEEGGRKSADGSIRINFGPVAHLSYLLKYEEPHKRGEVVLTFNRKDDSLKACLSPDKKFIAIAIESQGKFPLEIVDLIDKRVVTSIEGIGTIHEKYDEVTNCCFSPDNRYLAVTRELSPAMLYSTKSWQAVRRLAISEGASPARFPYFSAPGFIRLNTWVHRGIPETAQEDSKNESSYYFCFATFELPKDATSQDNAQ